MGYSENAYLKESLEKKKQAVEKALEEKRLAYEYELQKAAELNKTEGKDASKEYLSEINPYGYTAESIAKQGLNDSGISAAARSKAYSDYLKKLNGSNEEYKTSENEAYAKLAAAKAGAESDKLKAEGSYYDDIYDDYWKNKNFEYKLERAAVSDAKSAAKSSSGSTKSSKSTSGSSSKTNTSKTAASYIHSELKGTDYMYLGSSRSMSNSLYRSYQTKVWNQNIYSLVAFNEAKELTDNGTHPATAKAAAALLKKAKKEYLLSSEQLNKLSRYLAGE